ncbi:hypothetical protein F3Y22_tig00111088pilonHSYRG00180 [Hibiscus syriacus]|uniref:Uncharacterized protein n=1 Tax=Hibiscus syriacus TaxID=106335 RepID=A0A6A2Z3F4_HIBSY|nr:hypothetical protein F3Y22_tig00111088pilonHSYRG00180 [Hibiscus syriacus]
MVNARSAPAPMVTTPKLVRMRVGVLMAFLFIEVCCALLYLCNIIPCVAFSIGRVTQYMHQLYVDWASNSDDWRVRHYFGHALRLQHRSNGEFGKLVRHRKPADLLHRKDQQKRALARPYEHGGSSGGEDQVEVNDDSGLTQGFTVVQKHGDFLVDGVGVEQQLAFAAEQVLGSSFVLKAFLVQSNLHPHAEGTNQVVKNNKLCLGHL